MFLIIINKSVPEISIPLLTGGAAALFASIGLALMYEEPMVGVMVPRLPRMGGVRLL